MRRCSNHDFLDLTLGPHPSRRVRPVRTVSCFKLLLAYFKIASEVVTHPKFSIFMIVHAIRSMQSE